MPGTARVHCATPEFRAVLEASLRHGDGGDYRLGEFVFVPNHVHVMVHMLPGRELSEAVKAWKSVSSRRIGRRLGRTGTYWRDEYFDHAVRGDDSLLKFARYIRDNPRRLAPGTFTLGKGTLRAE